MTDIIPYESGVQSALLKYSAVSSHPTGGLSTWSPRKCGLLCAIYNTEIETKLFYWTGGFNNILVGHLVF